MCARRSRAAPDRKRKGSKEEVESVVCTDRVRKAKQVSVSGRASLAHPPVCNVSWYPLLFAGLPQPCAVGEGGGLSPVGSQDPLTMLFLFLLMVIGNEHPHTLTHPHFIGCRLCSAMMAATHIVSAFKQGAAKTTRSKTLDMTWPVATGTRHPHLPELMGVLSLQPDLVALNERAATYHGKTPSFVFFSLCVFACV